MSELNKRIGQAIRKIRKKQGLTQDQLAEAAGIHEKHIWRLESGAQGMSMEYLSRIARGLNMDIPTLIGEIFLPEKPKENKRKIINGIQSMLELQSLENLNLMRKVIAQLCSTTQKKKVLLLLDSENYSVKESDSSFIFRKV